VCAITSQWPQGATWNCGVINTGDGLREHTIVACGFETSSKVGKVGR
jgi:hypothetical protein